MATHSSVFALRIPGTGEPGGLLSMGSCRVGHDLGDLAAAAEGAASFVIAADSRWSLCSPSPPSLWIQAVPDLVWGLPGSDPNCQWFRR